MDKETAAQLSESQRTHHFVNSEDWQWVKEKLQNKLIGIDSLALLDTKDKSPEQVGVDVLVKKEAQKQIVEWMEELEGEAESYKTKADAMKPSNDPPLIVTIN
jgi:hypothetical protein